MTFIEPDKYYKSLPKKRIASAVLIFNEQGQLLIVKPNYKETWSLPGGVIEQNESPREAGGRECQEELGLKVEIGKLLAVDYVKDNGTGDRLQFIFEGGVLGVDEIGRIKLSADELIDFKFVNFEEALKLLNGSMVKRWPQVWKAWSSGTGVYLENGLAI